MQVQPATCIAKGGAPASSNSGSRGRGRNEQACEHASMQRELGACLKQLRAHGCRRSVLQACEDAAGWRGSCLLQLRVQGCSRSVQASEHAAGCNCKWAARTLSEECKHAHLTPAGGESVRGEHAIMIAEQLRSRNNGGLRTHHAVCKRRKNGPFLQAPCFPKFEMIFELPVPIGQTAEAPLSGVWSPKRDHAKPDALTGCLLNKSESERRYLGARSRYIWKGCPSTETVSDR